MPTLEVDCLTQKAVWWSKTGQNRFNEPTTAAKVEVNVRWETGNKETVNPSNATIAIDSTVVVDRAMKIGDLLWLGALKDIATPDSSVEDLREIVNYKETPDIKGRQIRRVAELIKFGNTLPALT